MKSALGVNLRRRRTVAPNRLSAGVAKFDDGTGTVVQRYEFDERGNHLISPMPGRPASPKTFVGGLSVNDDTADSELYLMGHRFYDGGADNLLFDLTGGVYCPETRMFHDSLTRGGAGGFRRGRLR